MWNYLFLDIKLWSHYFLLRGHFYDLFHFKDDEKGFAGTRKFKKKTKELKYKEKSAKGWTTDAA